MGKAVGDQEQIDAEAADWLVAIDCGTADRAAFERWRQGDPMHALAFIRASQISRGLDLLRETGLAESEAPASADGRSENVRPLDRRRFLKIGAASAFVLGAAGIGLSVAAAARDVETAVGERRHIVIGRGAVLDLNTNSHIRWHQRDQNAEIHLLKGELLLERAPGGIPCSIYCQNVRIDPVSGRVDAWLRERRVEVAVLHGEVIVRSPAASGVTRVASLQRTTLAKDSRPVLSDMTSIQAAAAEAWQQGEVQFDGEALNDAVAEYNRYLSRPMIIADPSIDRIRLGGRFSNSDPSDFLKALSAIYGVHVRETADSIRLSRA
jgi:transmembrane sensor